MQATDLSGSAWRRSSHSGGDNGSQCVEMAVFADHAAVRDSKLGHSQRAAAPALVFSVAAVTAFVAATKEGAWRRH
jgi:hypothetical protein